MLSIARWLVTACGQAIPWIRYIDIDPTGLQYGSLILNPWDREIKESLMDAVLDGLLWSALHPVRGPRGQKKKGNWFASLSFHLRADYI